METLKYPTAAAVGLALVAVLAAFLIPKLRAHLRSPSVAELFARQAELLPPPGDRVFTLEKLRQYDGKDETKPVYVAIKGVVFDVSSKRNVYGPGQTYGVFAGRDASYALGKMSVAEKDCHGNYSSLTPKEMKVLDDWELFFRRRYPIVGTVKATPKSD